MLWHHYLLSASPLQLEHGHCAQPHLLHHQSHHRTKAVLPSTLRPHPVILNKLSARRRTSTSRIFCEASQKPPNIPFMSSYESVHFSPSPMARSFFITRKHANSEDPTALEFWPAKGSDELHEALKEAFPFETNLAARMRAAVIEFLLQEQQSEQFSMSTSPEYLPSPQSSFISTIPSPAMTSSQQATPSSRQTSAGQPTQQQLMDVWSLPNQPQAKIHTRRQMTAEEKKAYKQKRLVGACADCKRRRRKVRCLSRRRAIAY